MPLRLRREEIAVGAARRMVALAKEPECVARVRGPSRWQMYLCQTLMPLYVEPVSRSRAASALASPRVRTSSFRRIADTW
jgi:hypothetical protein